MFRTRKNRSMKPSLSALLTLAITLTTLAAATSLALPGVAQAQDETPVTPTEEPTDEPSPSATTEEPTDEPSPTATTETPEPTDEPSVTPTTDEPTDEPSPTATTGTPEPTDEASPTPTPSPTPTGTPSPTPTETATATPTPDLTGTPDLAVQALATEHAISGTVTDQSTSNPVEGVLVWAWGQTTDFFETACTDASGNYEITNIPYDEEFIAGAEGSPLCPAGPDNYVVEFWQNTSNLNSALGITLTSGTPIKTGVDFSLVTGYVITGTVVDESAVGIDNATVNIYDSDTLESIWRAITVSDGSYSVAVRSDTYLVRAVADGYEFEYYDNAGQSSDDATPVNVTGNVSGIDFELGPGGTISGTVTAQDGGAPLEGVWVGTGDLWVGTCTDSSGDYEITNLPQDTELLVDAGRSTFGLCPGPNTYVREWWEEAASEAAATAIILTSGSPSQSNIDFTLEEGFLVTGEVTDGSNAIAGATVYFYDAYSDAQIAGAITDSLGQYTLGLAENTYIVRAIADGFASEYYDEAGQNKANATQLSITGDTSGIDFTLDPGGSVTGTVRDDGNQPLANIPVEINGISEGACTNASGNYTINYLPLSVYLKVQAAPAGSTRCNVSHSYAPEWWEEVSISDDATPIRLTASDPTETGINFTLTEGNLITGSVTDGSNGIAYATILIEDYSTGEDVATTRTNLSGNYYIVLDDGSYRLRASAEGYAFEYYDAAGQDEASATQLDVTTSITGVDFVLDDGGTISGTVTDNDTTDPIEDVWVHVDGITAGACTDDSGEYAIPNLALDTAFKVEANPFGAEACQPVDPYDSEWWDNKPDSGSADTITLTSGSPNAPGTDFALAPTTTITDPPPAPAGVSATDGDYADKVTITWHNVSTADTYEIYRSSTVGGTKTLLDDTLTTTTFDDTTGQSGALYYYWLKACNSNGCSGFSTYDPGYRAGESAIPTGVSATDGDYTDKVSVTWSAVSGADEYHISRATSETGTKTLLDDTVTTTSFDDTTATAVTFYWYWVQACNEYGCSDYSSPDRGFRSQESIGPVAYSDHTIDDDDSGDSSGNDDGAVQCGETIELPVDLVNQGTLTVTGVSATLSTSDAYVSITDSAETWGDIAGITEVTSTEDFDFTVDADTPDGHEISFDLDITATNGGPWSDSFSIPVSCPEPPEPAELLSNTSLETTVPNNWIGIGITSADGADCAVAHTGSCSAVLLGNDSLRVLAYPVIQSGSAGDVLNVSYWSRTQNAATGSMQVRVTLLYDDDTQENFPSHPAYGTHDWQNVQTNITASKDYNRLVVRLIYRDPLGKAWFDDLSLMRGSTELLDNGGLETTVPNNWLGIRIESVDGADCTLAHTGSCSAVLQGNGDLKVLAYPVIQSGSAGDTFDVSYWARTQNAPTGSIQVRVTLLYTDDTVENFPSHPAFGTHGWENVQTNVTASKDYDRLVVRLIYRLDGGKAWFDDISLIR